MGGAIIFTFCTIFFAVLSIHNIFLRGKDTATSRLEKLERGEQVTRRQQEETSSALSQGQSLAARRIKEKLISAGLKRKSDFEKYLLFQRICFATPAIAFLVFVLFFQTSLNTALIGALLVGVCFIAIPRTWLAHTTRKRQSEIRRCLPDTLDLFVIALEAGLSFDSALVRVGEEQRRVSTHISREFLFTNQQILVGKSREGALKDMAARCHVDEMDSLVRMVLQSYKLGTSLVKTLKTQAETLRKKRRQEVHAQIMKAPVKLIFPLLFFIFPTLLIVILAPSLVQIFKYLNVSGTVGG
ncbi:MAG: type II secretion system F family protein [Candidatus Omnitrophica bacterium]|nr:type II secretion system F family protein [Candidatus Omnitrophota bacterium]